MRGLRGAADSTCRAVLRQAPPSAYVSLLLTGHGHEEVYTRDLPACGRCVRRAIGVPRGGRRCGWRADRWEEQVDDAWLLRPPAVAEAADAPEPAAAPASPGAVDDPAVTEGP